MFALLLLTFLVLVLAYHCRICCRINYCNYCHCERLCVKQLSGNQCFVIASAKFDSPFCQPISPELSYFAEKDFPIEIPITISTIITLIFCVSSDCYLVITRPIPSISALAISMFTKAANPGFCGTVPNRL